MNVLGEMSMITDNLTPVVSGNVFFDKQTKTLLNHLPRHSIALLEHEDIDEMAAEALIHKKVKAVLNYDTSMTGKYPSVGTDRLLSANIPVFDVINGPALRNKVRQGDKVQITDDRLRLLNEEYGSVDDIPLVRYHSNRIKERLRQAETLYDQQLKSFLINTFHYAECEIENILSPLNVPAIRHDMKERTAVVVTRGSGYVQDFESIIPFVQKEQPVLIGVDGGADAILRCGYTPHIIFGDMDSVSKAALHSGAQLIVHAYPDGRAPGLVHLERDQLQADVFPCFGTSEDAALLLAYEAGAARIVSVGSHTHMVDFLEKGRQGMASTLLVRLKLGSRLIDAKGIRFLFSSPQFSGQLPGQTWSCAP
jgi:uncharacterized membrane-anchored protein